MKITYRLVKKSDPEEIVNNSVCKYTPVEIYDTELKIKQLNALIKNEALQKDYHVLDCSELEYIVLNNNLGLLTRSDLDKQDYLILELDREKTTNILFEKYLSNNNNIDELSEKLNIILYDEAISNTAKVEMCLS